MCDAGDPAADASGLRGAAPIAAAVPKALNESINHTYTELLHRFDKLLLIPGLRNKKYRIIINK